MHNLFVFHQEHPHQGQGKSSLPAPLELSGVPGDFFLWRTCVRSMWIGFSNEATSTYQIQDFALDVFQDEEAYRFLLEVICGLRSPLLGETEVAGQFRNFYASLVDLDSCDSSPEWKKLFANLMADLKTVRSKHLVGLGSQSYGSLCRRFLRPLSGVTLLGGGQLVQEILPWLIKDHKNVTAVARREEGRISLREKFPSIEVISFQEKLSRSCEAVIVAAPLEAKVIESWIEAQEIKCRLVIDLREDSPSDRITGVESVLNLRDFFGLIEQNKFEIESKVKQAHHAILERTRDRFREQSLRPFGWDDVCA